MAKYKVWFSPDALDDILASCEWGRLEWGDEAAERWLRELHEAVYFRLSKFPMSCPVAPESAELGSEVRQLVFLRYRILFEVDRRRVIVLHIHGPHTGQLPKSTLGDFSEP